MLDPSPARLSAVSQRSIPPDLAIVAPADVTIVRGPNELQQAVLSGAVDIEIRDHLDLRSVPREMNPAVQDSGDAHYRKRFALLYAGHPLRSIRVRLCRATLRRLRLCSAALRRGYLCSAALQCSSAVRLCSAPLQCGSAVWLCSAALQCG